MTDYNDGKWHGWNGGECPVHLSSVVKGIEPTGIHWTSAAGDCDWFSFKGAFRVVKEYREPREVWLQEGYMTGSWLVSDRHRPGAVLFREVIE